MLELLQHKVNYERQTKLSFPATFCSLCSVHYEPVCVLKHEEKTETLGKNLLTQSEAKGRRVALSAGT